MEKFKLQRFTMAGLRIYYGIGKEGQSMTVHIPKPVTRKEHTNIFAVIRGYVDCVGPGAYGVQRFTKGMMGTDLPPYTEIGNYLFHPGPEGLEFFCITTYPRSNQHEFEQIELVAGNCFKVPEGHILAVIEGCVSNVNAPLLVDASKKDKTVRVHQKMQGLLVRATNK